MFRSFINENAATCHQLNTPFFGELTCPRYRENTPDEALAGMCGNVRFGSKAAPEAYSSPVAALGVKRTLRLAISVNFEWLLSARSGRSISQRVQK